MLCASRSSFVCCGIFYKEYSFYMSHRCFRQVPHTGLVIILLYVLASAVILG